jgi:hypothetical protein
MKYRKKPVVIDAIQFKGDIFLETYEPVDPAQQPDHDCKGCNRFGLGGTLCHACSRWPGKRLDWYEAVKRETP